MIEDKYLVTGTLLDSVVQAMEEAMYQAEVNSWELDVDFTSTVEEVRDLLSGPAYNEFEQKTKEDNGPKEERAQDAVEAAEKMAAMEDVPA